MASPTSQPSSSPPLSFTYPFATSPDIIRSNQKDAFFTSRLTTDLSSILRRIYGQRFTQTHTLELSTFSELLYLGLTTFIGNRTLGEEYCDIVQVQSEDGRLPAVGRRAGYILGTRVRLKLEAKLRKDGTEGETEGWIARYLLDNLGTITSPSLVYAITLAVFYFSGSYYHLSKRIFGLRYIFTKRLAEGEQRVGYEVLGVLLVMQMAVQGWMHVRETVGKMSAESKEKEKTELEHGNIDHDQYAGHGSLPEREQVAEAPVSKSRMELMTHTPELGEEPRVQSQSSMP
ncbi:MAG: hypothetical protein Q9225_006450 [Loekoesia sp. 1 TL-2023]